MTEPTTEQVFSYGDYLTWGNDIRCELIDGVVYDMTPAPRRIHQRVLSRLLIQMSPYFVGEAPCEFYVAPFDVRLPEADEGDEETKTVVQPDIVVICDPSKLDDRECRGAPDWVIEIVSPSTASKDHMQKLVLYEKHGVREYWIVHPKDRIVMVYRMFEQGQYGRPLVFSVGQRVGAEVVEGMEIDLSEIFEE